MDLHIQGHVETWMGSVGVTRRQHIKKIFIYRRKLWQLTDTAIHCTRTVTYRYFCYVMLEAAL